MKRKKPRQAGKRKRFRPRLKSVLVYTSRSLPLVLILVLGLITVNQAIGYLYSLDYQRDGEVDIYLDGQLLNETLKNPYKIDSDSIDIGTHDLELLRQRLQTEHPEALKVKLRRELPDRIVVEIENRKPIAQIKLKDYFPIDSEGVILSGQSRYAEEGLPIIVGGLRETRLNTGFSCNTPNILKALELLQAMDESDFLKGRHDIKIDCFDYQNLSFFLKDGTEVRIGNGEFAKRLEALRGVLQKLDYNTENVKYIDLRFKDVVIGPRWGRR